MILSRMIYVVLLSTTVILFPRTANAACNPSTDTFVCPQIAADRLGILGTSIPFPKFAPNRALPLKVISKPIILSPQFSSCLSQLASLASALPTQHPNKKDPACTIPQPVSVKSISKIAFTRPLTLDCPFALALSNFIIEMAIPLAREKLATELSGLSFGPGYVCRRRNNAKQGKLSEHAFGNAIDLAAFHFASGKTLAIRTTEDMEPSQAAFFTTLRQHSCKVFTTVLGPGTNSAHATHLHFDLGRSKTSKTPYRICE